MLLLRFTLIYILSFNALAIENPIKELLESIPHRENLTEKQIQILKEELSLQSSIIEAVEQIKLSQGEFINAKHASSVTRDLIIQTSLAKYVFKDDVTKTNFIEMVKEIYKPEQMKNMIKELSQVSKNFVNWQVRSVVETARTQGLVYSLVKFISLQMDTTVPFVLMATGNIAAGAAVLVSPVSPVVLFPFKVIKDGLKTAMLIKRLGMKDFINLHKLNRQIKNKFNSHFLSELKLINAKIFDYQYVIKYENTSVLKKVFRKKSYLSSINLDSVSDFLNEQGQYRHFLTSLSKSNVPEELKLLTLVAAIENSNDMDLQVKFYERFKQSIFKSPNIDISQAHRRWVLKTAHAESFEKLYELLRKMPDDLHPQVLDRVWRKYIFPTLAENIEGGITPKTYKTFRNIEAIYNEKIRVSFSQETSHYIGRELKTLFINNLFSAMGPVGSCEFIYKQKVIRE